MIVLEETVSISHEDGPKLIMLSGEKPFPRMVTKVPPYVLPLDGEKLSMTKVLVTKTAVVFLAAPTPY